MSMPKELGFITPTFMTVFELFLSDPLQEYHEREVVRAEVRALQTWCHMLASAQDTSFRIEVQLELESPEAYRTNLCNNKR